MDGAPTTKALTAARARLERRLRAVSGASELDAAARDREQAALRTAIAIVDRLLAARGTRSSRRR